MSEKKMTVLLIEPNQYPKKIEMDGTLEALQGAVGGTIQAVYPYQDSVALVVNDEGKLLNLPLNRSLRDASDKIYDIVSGSFMVVGLGSENFTSLNNAQLDKYEKLFHQPEAFVKAGRYCVPLPVPDELVGKEFTSSSLFPVCYSTYKEAQQGEHEPFYFASRQMNQQCKKRIEEILTNNFDGLRLKHESARQAIAEFGAERVGYVLAGTVQVKLWDERFSPRNKEWSQSISPNADKVEGYDRRRDYAVNSHPAVVDGFISQFRRELREQQKEKAPTLNEKLSEAKEAVQQEQVNHQPVKTKNQEQSL